MMNYDLSQWEERRRLLIDFQKSLLETFPEENYNVFVFGSFIREDFDIENSDIDIIIYCKESTRSYSILVFVKQFFEGMIPCDVIEYFYYPEAFVYINGILNAFRMTDYYPQELKNQMYVISRYYERYLEEQQERKKYLEWSKLIKKERGI